MRESVLFVLAREVIGYGRIMRPDIISLCDCDYVCVVTKDVNTATERIGVAVM